MKGSKGDVRQYLSFTSVCMLTPFQDCDFPLLLNLVNRESETYAIYYADNILHLIFHRSAVV